ncbi:MAG: flagellar motor protein MotB [Rickettsiales bacterium]
MDHENDASTEHFFTAFTDLLVGVIFLFILMLMVFALNLKHPEDVPPVVTTEQIRANILSEVAKRMQARGLPITLDLANGVVRLPESLLFASGQWVLSGQGQQTVAALAQVFEEVLPCASYAQKPCQWQAQPVLLDSVLIEGHTDRRPFASPEGYGNWELSAFRAIAVYKAMVATAPELENAIANAQQQPLLGVSAYADRRPVDPAALDPNRRIDVRFNMRANAIPTP